MTIKRPTAKKVMKNISFSDDTSHIALVGPAVGGPANGADYALVMKSANFSPETIAKMQKIRVTLDVDDFLEKFFGLYGTDAEVLARLMGYVPDAADEVDGEVAYDPNWYENLIQDRLSSFEVIKSMKDTNPAEVLSKLNEKQYLKLLRDQARVEKAFRQIAKMQKKSTEEALASDGDTSTQLVENTDVEARASGTKMEKSMSTKDDLQVEMVEKAALVKEQTKVSELLGQIEKATARIAEFESALAETVRKARLDKVKAAVKDEAKAQVLFKALNLVEKEEDFDAALKPLIDMQASIEKSALFEEQGASVETNEPVKESGVAKALKAQLKK